MTDYIELKRFSGAENTTWFLKGFTNVLRIRPKLKKCFDPNLFSGLLLFLFVVCPIDDAHSQLPQCPPATCGMELFCYGDFDDLTPASGATSTYFDQLGLTYCPNLNGTQNNTPDVWCVNPGSNGNQNVAIRIGTQDFGNFYEAIYIPISNGLQPGCTLQINFDAVQLSGSQASLNFFASKDNPCSIGVVPNSCVNSGGFTCINQSVPTAIYFAPIFSHDCVGLFSPYPDASYQNISFNWPNNTGETINYITVSVGSPNNNEAESILIDNISVLGDCDNTLTLDLLNPPTEVCADGEFTLEYQLCVLGSGTSPVDVTLTPQITSGNPLFDLGAPFTSGSHVESVVPGNCTNVSLPIDLLPNNNLPSPPGNIEISIDILASNTCVEGSSDLDYALGLLECMPTTCDCPANSVLIGSMGVETFLSTEVGTGPNELPIAPVNSIDVVIKGTLVMDANNITNNPGTYNFPPNSNICMLPGAEIKVPDGNTLTIEDGTHIRGCDKRWEGITVEAGGTLKLTGTSLDKVVIEDAQQAVQLLEGATVNLDQVVFENNFYGLYHIGTGGSFSMPIISNVSFIGTENLLPPSDGSTDPDPWANTGIFVTDQKLLRLSTGGGSGPVLFDNLRTGILISNTDAIISNAEFKNIVAVPNIANSGNAIAGFGNGNILWVWDFVGFPSNVFSNCTNGINATGTNIRVKGVDMTNIGNNGIVSRLAHDFSLLVWDSEISAAGNGIWIDQSNGTYVKINDNKLTVIPPVAGHPVPNEANAFLATSTNPGGGTALVRDNEISLIDGSNGINLQSTLNYDIRYNAITTGAGAVEYTGINLDGCDRTILKTNEVTGVFAGTTATDPYNSFGIKVNNSFNGFYSCNDVDATEIGMGFDSGCQGTKLQNTYFNSHFYGLHYSILGQTGPQPVDDPLERTYRNRWFGNHSGNSRGALHESSSDDVLGQNVYPVKGNAAPAFPPNIDNLNNPNWFLSRPLRQEVLQSCQVGTTPGGETGKSATDNMDENIADGTFVSDGYQAPMQWMAERYLYKHLELNDALRPAGSTFESFYQAQANTTVGQFTAVEMAIESLFVLSGAEETQLTGLYDQRVAAMDSIAVLDTLLLGATGANYNQLAAERGNQIILLDSLAQSSNALIQNIQANRAALVPGVIAQNNAASAVEVFEQNEKTVNGVFLQSNALGNELDSLQITVLEGVAQQCPYSGGSAVLWARGLLAGKSQMTFDNNACSGQGQQQLVQEGGAGFGVLPFLPFRLFPNPAKESFTLSIGNAVEAHREVQVVDAHGKVVRTKVMGGKDRQATFLTKGLVPGMYFVKVMENGKDAFSGKIIVQ